MSLLRKLHLVKSLLTVALAAPLLISCYSYDHEEVPVAVGGNKYLNMTISVSAGGCPITRAGEVPAGGENGDGREAGFFRENDVTGATLFFYRATDGINADASTAIDYVVYYPVTPTTVKRDDPSTSEAGIDDTTRPVMTADEYVFTTGDRLLEPGKINPNETYHVIAVLNADLSKAGLTTLGAVRDYKFDVLYSGGLTGDVQSCTNFIMTSEEDFTLKLASLTPTKKISGDYYALTTPLRVERLAARIDFETEFGTGKACVGYNSTLPSGSRGYEYHVGTYSSGSWSSSDMFVVTAITPFNINTKTTTYGGEFLIKRLTDDLGTSGKIRYLADEALGAPAADKYCYVLDPDTKAKESATSMDNFVNTLKVTLNNDLTTSFIGLTASKYPYQTVESLYDKLHVQGGSDTNTGGLKLMSGSDNTGDIMIVGYPMENTLGPNAKLYDYATGLAIEGDYYKGGLTGTKSHIVYYGFLRHQGESSSISYAAYPMTTDLTTLQAMTCNSSYPMNYSIVRNNIYRVSIESITPKGSLLIKVKKWDPFIHDFIYM